MKKMALNTLKDLTRQIYNTNEANTVYVEILELYYNGDYKYYEESIEFLYSEYESKYGEPYTM